MVKVTREHLDQYMSSHLHAEKKGWNLISQMIRFAPREEDREWIQNWLKEKALHYSLWDFIMKNRSMEPKKIDLNLWKLFDIAESFVLKKDWIGSIVCTSFIDHLLSASASYLYFDADDDMRRVFRRIVGDKMAHINFGLQHIAKTTEAEEDKRYLMTVYARILTELIEWPLRPNTIDADIDILNDAYHMHRIALKKLGIRIPKLYFTRMYDFEAKETILKMIA